jgi:hypothetical protein
MCQEVPISEVCSGTDAGLACVCYLLVLLLLVVIGYILRLATRRSRVFFFPLAWHDMPSLSKAQHAKVHVTTDLGDQ